MKTMKCTKDLFMIDGQKCFTKGRMYTRLYDEGTTVYLADDQNRPHGMGKDWLDCFINMEDEQPEKSALRQFYHTFISLEMWYKVWRMKDGMAVESKLSRFRHKLRHYSRRCYIAGAITSIYLKQAYTNFEEAEEEVKGLNYIPVNPMTIHEKEYSWAGYMVRDMVELALCGTIYLQSNWRKSTGAVIEMIFSVITFKTIIHEQS